jgi:hypothetical protein
MNELPLQLYHQVPYPLRVLAASAWGHYLRWWGLWSGYRTIGPRSLGQRNLDLGKMASVARGTAEVVVAAGEGQPACCIFGPK